MNQVIVNPDYVTSQFNCSIIERISIKAEQIKARLQKISDRYLAIIQKCYKIVASIKKIIEIVSNNYFNESHIFTHDLNKTFQIIDTALEAYYKAIFYFQKLKHQKKNVINLENSFENFSQIIEIFTSTIEDIASEVKKETDENKIEKINIRLGLESALFNITVKIEIMDEIPFYKSKFIEIYKFHNIIFDMKENLKGIESVCGTGKTICLPIILLCHSMKNQFNSPFLIITQPTPRHIEPKEEFFKQIISKYATIVSDPDELFEIYNEYEKTKKNSKICFGTFNTS